ncbi:hypothetical protein CR513_37368, partial [Mucuna pruriens]
MEASLEALNLWEAVKEDYDVLSLLDNPTIAQIKSHKEKKQERQRQREFELQRMKEYETIKEYSDKLLGIANKMRLLGSDFVDSRIIEIFLMQEQQRLIRKDCAVEGALQAKYHNVGTNKKKYFKKNQAIKGKNSANNQNKVVGVFMKLKKMVETQSDYKVQFLRSDNGKEYTSTQFNQFCEEAGIEHQLTALYTSKQNGVKRDKLDKKAILGIFMGCSSISKAYKISILVNNSVSSTLGTNQFPKTLGASQFPNLDE